MQRADCQSRADLYDGSMPLRALVLAGRRSTGDAVADSSGLRHRALLPIAGTPMLERVVAAVDASGDFAGIHLSCDDEGLLTATPALAALAAPPRSLLRFHRSSTSPAASVADFAEKAGTPFLVTTADHPLLTPEVVRYFVEAASRSTADVAVGLVPATVYRRRFPDQPRTFIPLRGELYSGANLFYLRTPAAVAVPRFWTRAEAWRKTPWKLAGAFGWTSLLLFLLRRLDLRAALRRASAVIGATVEAVELPFAEAALDVDKEADRLAVEEVFAERARAGRDAA